MSLADTPTKELELIVSWFEVSDLLHEYASYERIVGATLVNHFSLQGQAANLVNDLTHLAHVEDCDLLTVQDMEEHKAAFSSRLAKWRKDPLTRMLIENELGQRRVTA